jgi:1,2-diacylglycerol 3-alpha-glucosyltransferase
MVESAAMDERPHVASFTDTYLPTVNGVTYSIKGWRDRYRDRGGRMDIVFPAADGYTPTSNEHPLRSVDFPFYDGYRLSGPTVPDAVRSADVVHTHTPFGVGLGGLRLARASGARLVASYHTPTAEYAEYLLPTDLGVRTLRGTCRRYERWFFDHADVVLAPSSVTAQHVRDLGVSTPVEVLPNGVDTELFRPVDDTAFRERYDLPKDRPLVGYTGRHGFEKRLSEAIAAAADLDVTLVFGGDGPARESLEREARRRGVDAVFLGFIERSSLPAFYSALDALVFPSPVETQGLVALEANACGTPVVGADEGALSDTIEEGVTGYRVPTGDIEALRAGLQRALDEGDRLSASCLDTRSDIGIDRAVDRLETYYRE